MGPNNGSNAPRGLLAIVSMAGLVAAVIGLSAQAPGRTVRPIARQAKRVYFVEVAKLKFHAERGATVIDTGNATGTYRAPLTAEMRLHPTYVSAVVTIKPHGGTITGTAHASFVAVKNLLYFGGQFTLGRGTGRFRHISEVNGKPLGFSGVLNQETHAGEVKAHGEANE